MTKAIAKKGRAYLYSSGSGRVTKVHSPLLLEATAGPAEFVEVFRAVTQGGGSKRLREKYGETMAGVRVARRPFDMALYAYASVVNTYNAKCVDRKASDICGRPWQIVGDAPETKKKELEALFKNSFGEKGFGVGMKCLWTDHEAVGNAYLEVIPDGTGKPAAFAQIPAVEVWFRLDGLGFVQRKGSDFAHFRAHFLEKERFRELPETDPLHDSHKPNTAIHFAKYSPFSPFYGLPDVMPAIGAVALFQLIREYNLAFFENNAIPDYAVILEGEWDDDAEEVIETYFKEHIKGKAHKTMVLSTGQGNKVTFQKLTDEGAKEGSFRLARKDARDEIIQAHGVPPQKVGIVETGALGGNAGAEQIRDYQESVVEPGQELVASAMTRLIAESLEVANARFEFIPVSLDDDKLNADIDDKYVKMGAITAFEVRRQRYPELPEDPEDFAVTQAAGELAEAVKGLQKTVRELSAEGAR